MKYFVSYTLRDKVVTKELLQRFSWKLRKYGDVFVDIIDNDSRDKQARVIFEIDNSNVMILVKSRNVYKSAWVSIELERAKERKMPIRIFPVCGLSDLTASEIASIIL